MSWRTVCITKRAKLEYRMGYLHVRAEEITKIHLSEIAVLIIESTAVSLTVNLLNELIKNNIKVIFCDVQHNPSSELLPYYGAHDCSKSLRLQLNWQKELKADIWQIIVKDKIAKQAYVLEHFDHEKAAELLCSYIDEVEQNDNSNREGHAAKVYFNSLFGNDFSRHSDGTINAALDYGYSLILACFNRAIAAQGKLTQLGIWHDNIFNYFNLSCDLMEAFRPLVDKYVKSMTLELKQELTKENKHHLLKILEEEVQINDRKYKLPKGISVYVQYAIKALDQADLTVMPRMEYV